MQKFLSVLAFLFFFGLNQLQAQHQCAKTKLSAQSRALNKANATPSEMIQMEKYDVYFHHLNLSVERTSTYISGNVITKAKSRAANLDTFVFQLHANFTIDSVLGANNQRLSVIRTGDIAYVLLAQSVQTGKDFTTQIFYHGTPPSGASAAIGNGFSNRASPTYGNQITWSLSQPYSAYEWWPCKQSLQDKIDSVFISVTTDVANMVGSNGLLKNIEYVGNNKHVYHWESHYPTAYYLVMVTVGQYTEYLSYAKPKNYADSILIQHYIYSNPLAYSNNKASIDAALPQLELFSDLFGLYPFHQEKYGHVMAPFSGGMEHQTMTSLGIFDFDIVAHELGHQWFGDHVTCATWSDIWLNEGFATYTEYLAAKYLKSAAYTSTWVKDMHTSAKKGIGSVYVTDTTDVTRIFSSNLTYNKGGSAIRVLHYLLGDSMFFNVCKTYQTRFANATASTNDFRLLVNELSGKNYDYFFNQWIYGAGFPNYTVKWNQIDGQFIVSILQNNAQQSSNVFDLPLPFVVTRLSGDSTIYLTQNALSNGYFVPVIGKILSVKFDPENWILKNSSVVADTSLLSSLGMENSLTKFVAYPNPSDGKLYLKGFGGAWANISIFDQQGKTCFVGIKKEGELIDLSALKSGVYFLQVLNEFGAVHQEKLIIR
ncbi:MAG: M1 family aminopeptidase [bacterium]|nr:M1 family aminopeptidase [bacterium]